MTIRLYNNNKFTWFQRYFMLIIEHYLCIGWISTPHTLLKKVQVRKNPLHIQLAKDSNGTIVSCNLRNLFGILYKVWYPCRYFPKGKGENIFLFVSECSTAVSFHRALCSELCLIAVRDSRYHIKVTSHTSLALGLWRWNWHIVFLLDCPHEKKKTSSWQYFLMMSYSSSTVKHRGYWQNIFPWWIISSWGKYGCDLSWLVFWSSVLPGIHVRLLWYCIPVCYTVGQVMKSKYVRREFIYTKNIIHSLWPLIVQSTF